jgi:hypothetical protein
MMRRASRERSRANQGLDAAMLGKGRIAALIDPSSCIAWELSAFRRNDKEKGLCRHCCATGKVM